jgi:hypothetical protein
LPDFKPDWNITNVGEAAAGNQYIADSVIRAVLERPNYYDHVLVMWSGVSRLDFLTDVSDPNWNALFDSYGFYRRIPGNKLGWIFSGGQMGTWFKNPVAHKMFYEMYKVSSELTLAHTNISEIVKIQNFLKSKNINYNFMSYVNYWNQQDHVSPNGDFGVYKYPELGYLINDIAFDRWIFSDKNKNGLYELARELNDFAEDKFHPGANAYKQWASFVASAVESQRQS